MVSVRARYPNTRRKRRRRPAAAGRGDGPPEPDGDGRPVRHEGGETDRDRPQAHLSGQDRRLLGGDDEPPAVDHELHVAEALPLEGGGEAAQEPPREPADREDEEHEEP
jgi:hypothetical protein